jgi:transcriptional regulator with GAF, ATPase, and Fis domain
MSQELPKTSLDEVVRNLDLLRGTLAEQSATINRCLKEYVHRPRMREEFAGELEPVHKAIHGQVAEVEAASRRVAARLDQIEDLARIMMLMTSSLEIDLVLEDVMDTIVDLTGAERAYLMLYDNRQNLEVRAARNWDQQTLSQADVGLSQSVVDAAIREDQPIVTTNAQADQRFSGRESIVLQQLRSIICVPLSLAGHLVGVLYADNRYKEGAFEEDIIPILTAFGAQAATAITNANVFGQMKANLEKAQQIIQELRIQIDQGKVDAMVEEITETGYFRRLSEAAREARRRRKEGRVE